MARVREIALPWTQQPPLGQTQVNRSSPLSSGLRRLIDARQIGVDLADGAPVTTLIGGTVEAPYITGPAGEGRLIDRLSYNTVAQVPSWADTTGGASALIVFESTNNYNYWWDLSTPGGNSDHFPYGGLAYSEAFWGSRWLADVAPIPGRSFQGRPVCVVVSVRSGQQRAYWDGALWHANTLTGALNLNSTLTLVSAHTPTPVYLAALWDRALNDEECAEVGANPWQLFAPRVIIIPVSAGAGGDTTLVGVQATGNVAAPSASVAVSVALSGVAGAGATGTSTAASDTSVGLTGTQATGSAGTLSVVSEPTALITGAAGSGQVSAPAAASAADAALAGVQGAGSVGAPSASAAVDVPITGVQAAVQVSAPAAASHPAVLIGSVGATGTAAQVSAYGDAAVDGGTTLAGVAATGHAGTVAASSATQAEAQPAGVQATGAVGTIAAQGEAVVALSGVSATGGIAAPTAGASADAAITGVQATGSVGALTAAAATDAAAALSSVAAAGSPGVLTAYSNAAAVTLSGVGASGEPGTLGVPSAVQDVPIDGVTLGLAAAEYFARKRQREAELAALEAQPEPCDARVVLRGVEACGHVARPGAEAQNAPSVRPMVADVPAVVAAPAQIVTLQPRTDARVELAGVCARLLPFRPRVPTQPVPMPDPDLVALHNAQVTNLLLAGGWR